MRTEKEIQGAIKRLKKEASVIRLTNGKIIPRPPNDCGWAVEGDRIDALLWVLEKQNTIAGIKIGLKAI